MSIGLIGTKIGMTREFMESGQSVPVTVIRVEKGRVLDVISEDKRGYSAVKLGFFKLKNSKLTKQMKGYFSTHHTTVKHKLKERKEGVPPMKNPIPTCKTIRWNLLIHDSND